MNYIITQMIGAVAYILLIISYYRSKKKEILFIQIISSLFFAAHYYLLAGITGAICNILSLTMQIIIYLYEKRYEEKNKIWLICILIPILISIAMFSWQNIYSIFPIIASSIILTSFLFKKESVIRLMGCFGAAFWWVYAIYCGSHISIIFEAITIVGTIGAVLREKEGKAKEAKIAKKGC